ncbi:hypothetical protein DICSQDRAFT_173550 [Dichomitus squalens LYAD-421 SS1]|uniref:Uncharacterized protein n=1 Tax=Dichomitus squalens (strain LYAD-421) TaxID=732165 RepID=R7SNY8_DICSQ|nr:uncharacterized protein DICSQDRAFT_173550 [Dichomitus squalens LYAD-421 SS1]EJF57801.1 hypothetical protein DICSQDRAFT_173550 [Dichomitus squalens LYAD-421 SS1]
MASPSFEDLASWDDLNIVSPDNVDDPEDPRNVDLRKLPEEIEQLDQSIAELEAKIATLRLQRAKLLDQRALIRRLSPDLLSRIFELGVHESADLLPNLSLVSHHWRSVVLSSPTLWTYIILDSNWSWRIPSFLRRMRAHLQRSRASKLFIDIDFRHVDSLLDTETILLELKPHLWRCYSYNVSVPDWFRMRKIQEHSSTMGPALEDLYLRVDSSDSEYQEPFSVFSQPCPRLVYAMLEHMPMECLGVPTSSLRQFHLLRDARCHSPAKIGYPFNQLMSILTSSPIKCFSVRFAFFTIDTTEDVFRATPTPQVLPSLEGLSFDAVDAGSVSLFLESTSLPALQLLSVNSGVDLQWLTQISLTSSRFPALRLLDLCNCLFTGPSLVPLVRALHHLPQLTGLGISTPATGVVGTHIFDMLAAGPDTLGEWLLPRLEAIGVQNCEDVTGHELLRVVTARRGAAAPEVSNIVFLKITQCLLDSEVLERLTQKVDTVLTVDTVRTV